MLQQLKEDERGLLRAVIRALPDDTGQLLLVIDQFEELFTQTKDQQEREQFLRGLVNALSDQGSRFRVVLTLRADYYDRPLQYVEFGELVRQGTEVVLPLSESELVEAITRPSENAGVILEQGLVSKFIADLREQPGALPLLQFALTELFENRDGNQLTVDNYLGIGGIVGALGRRAEELFAGFDEIGQEAIRQLFLRLVSPGEGVEDSRRRVLRSELITLQSSKNDLNEEVFDQVLEGFGRSRILTFDRDPLTRAPTVEIAHEALFLVWQRLEEWVNTSREHLHQHRRLMVAASEWVESHKDSSYLLQGARLVAFEIWTTETDLALTPVESEFLQASLAERLSKQQSEEARLAMEKELVHRTRKLRNALFVAIGLVLVGALVVCVLTPQFLTNLFRPPVSPQRVAAWDQGRGVTFDHQSGVLAVSGTDNSPTIRDPLTGDVLMEFVGHTDRVLNIDFSSDGRCIATTSLDGYVKVWDPLTGEAFLTVHGGYDELVSPALNADCTRLAFTSVAGDVQIRDVSDGTLLDTAFPGGQTLGLDFSPDGTLLAIATSNKLVEVLELSSREFLFTLKGHESTVSDVVFSPGGDLLATSSFDGAARIWDASSGDLIKTFRGDDVALIGIDINYDGTWIATCGDDGVVKVWEISTGRELLTLTGHNGIVMNVAFHPSSEFLASGSDKNETFVWKIVP
jgi:hypothetical protein